MFTARRPSNFGSTRRLLQSALWAGALMPCSAAVGQTTILTITGEVLDGGPAEMFTTLLPRLNDSGQAAFRGSAAGVGVTSGNNSGLFFDGTTDVLTSVMREGDTASLGTGTASGNFVHYQINEGGQVAFHATMDAIGVVDNMIGLWNGTTVTNVARIGNPVPGGNGDYGGFGALSMNDAGQVAYVNAISGATGGAGNSGIYRYNSDGTTTTIARALTTAPAGDGTFNEFFRTGGQEVDDPAMNAAGQVAFRANVTGTGGTSNYTAIFRSDGTTTTELLRRSTFTPDGVTKFSSINFDPAINDSGQVAVQIGLTGTGVNGSNNIAIYIGDDGPGGNIQIARRGDALPDGGGTFGAFVFPNLNNNGQVGFFARLDGTDDPADNVGLYRGDGTTTVKIARTTETAPDGNGTFATFDRDPVLNDDGDAVFRTTLTGTAGGIADNNGVYVFNDYLGLTKVAREGDALLGSTIVALDFSANTFMPTQDEMSGLNERGDVSYGFFLADGRYGVAIWQMSLLADADGSGAVTTTDIDSLVGTDFNGDGTLNWSPNTSGSDADAVILGAMKTFYGDANLDGTVDLLDLDVLGANWGAAGAGWGGADFNFDGVSDLLDLDLLGANWGSGSTSFAAALASSGIAVPEPAAAVLLAVGTGCIGLRRRSRLSH